MISGKRKTLVLIDAHAVLHRAFHALPDFTSPKGEPTGALYGFSAFLIKIIRELKPDYIAACYDLPEPTFRHAAYENYKAKRPKMDEGLAGQINRSREILKAFDVPVYDSPGFEADDTLGTIVEQLFQISNLKSQISNLKIIVASGDLDTLQLVKNDDVVVYTLSKGIKETIIYDEEKVKGRYGFGPELIPDFKGLKGDPSDNILGVQGVGEKTATDLIKNFGSIENLYKELKKDKKIFEKKGFKPRIIKILEENEEEAIFSKTLAEIRRDAPIKFSLEESKWDGISAHENIKTIFGELGFKSLIERLEENNDQGQQGRSPTSSPTKSDFVRHVHQDSLHAGLEVPQKLLDEVEKPLSGILKEMSEAGILIDTEYLNKLSGQYRGELEKLGQKIWSLSGEKFNINSPKQLAEVLFAKLGLKTKGVRKTSTGGFSTNISELEKMRGGHPIIGEIISHREFAKLISTYVDALPKLVDKNSRLHTTFDQFGTTTGRISSKNPNLQNIPKRTELGKNIRRAFVADKGFKLVSFDYSQIELRVAAILSNDQKLKQIFQRGEDVHTAVASEVFNVPPNEITEEMRRRAKVINFGIIYGMGLNALRQNLGCSREEAAAFYEEFFKDFRAVADFIEKTKEDARKNGYTETIFGRKRFFPEINSPIEYVRKEAERMAINAPIQGSAADFIKLAMVKIDVFLKNKKLKDRVKMLLQIHDELLFEIEEGALDAIAPEIKREMENVYQGDIPIKVNVFAGKNWEDMVECK